MCNRNYFELVLGMSLVTKSTRFASNSLVCLSFGMSWEELEMRLESQLSKNPP